jgi:hypothetical protein
MIGPRDNALELPGVFRFALTIVGALNEKLCRTAGPEPKQFIALRPLSPAVLPLMMKEPFSGASGRATVQALGLMVLTVRVKFPDFPSKPSTTTK